MPTWIDAKGIGIPELAEKISGLVSPPRAEAANETDCTPTVAGDAYLIETLTDRESSLRRYLRRRIRAHEDEQDYVHEVYARVLGMSGAETAKIRNWPGFLVRVASNVLIDMSRRRQSRRDAHHVDLEEALAMADELAFDGERLMLGRARLEEVDRCLARLDHPARRALIAVRVQGMSHVEVAQELGVAKRDVSRLIERALYALARDLAELDDPVAK